MREFIILLFPSYANLFMEIYKFFINLQNFGLRYIDDIFFCEWGEIQPYYSLNKDCMKNIQLSNSLKTRLLP